MRQLHKRLEGLESKLRPSKLHVVRCYSEQTGEEAVAAYVQDGVVGADDLVVVIRKPHIVAPESSDEAA